MSSAEDQEQRLRDVRDLMLSAPPGQFESILEDVLTVLASSSVSTEPSPAWIDEVRADYKSRTGASVLTEENASSTHPLSSDLQERMRIYAKGHYSSKGVSSAIVVTDGAMPSHDLVIRTYAERIDQPNYHSGSWTAKWQVQVPSNVISGQVHLRAHTYEDERNFHLQSTYDFGPVTLPSKGDADLIENIVAQISTWESKDVLDSLGSMYQHVRDKELKSLRRVMPITRTRMDWNVLAHRMVKTLGDNPVQNETAK